MKPVKVPREPVTIERLERGLAVAAYMVTLHGPTVVPVFERLERELAMMKANQDAIGRAKKLLDSFRLPSQPSLLGSMMAATINETT